MIELKGLQSLIRKYLKDHEKHKRYLSIIMCLSMIVTFAVPMSLIMPAISMTNNADSEESSNAAEPLAYNNDIGKSLGNLHNANGGVDGNEVDGKIYSPGVLPLKTLLVGEGAGVAWAENCNDIDALMDAAMDEYFLGIANDFCAFIEGDFAATDADAEGRVLIGGNLTFNGHKDEWNYQIGSGNYSDMTNLEATDNYKDKISKFASVIVGGRMENINTLSTGYGHDRNGKKDWNKDDRKEKDADYHSVNINSQYAQDAYTVYYKPDEGLYKRFLIGNIDDSKHIFYEDDKKVYVGYTRSHSHDYPGDCGETCPHEYLAQTNELAQMYQYSEIPYIVQKSFEQIRERSLLLSKKKTVSAATEGEHTGQFVGPGTDSNVKTVYFNIDSWDKRGEIEFWDIPEGANIVVNVKGTNPELGTLKTKINGNSINNEDNERTNNHVDSQRILYNFYEAKTLDISGNFNGTILAPNADVTSPAACPGHLSGALIAKSFKGGLEFGYRPYRGAADILGSSSGYAIPVDKITSVDTFLPGASFEIVENIVKDGRTEEELVSAWISSNETKYSAIPTAVDYSGDTTYSDTENTVITKNYTLKEVSAPDGYIKAENYYTITVEETIDKNYLLPNDNRGTFPQKVDVNVTITEKISENSSTSETLNFTVKDAYGNTNRQRRIYVKDADGNVTSAFAVDFIVDGDKQTAKAVKQIDTTDTSDSTVTITHPPKVETTTSTARVEKPTMTTVGTRVATYTIDNVEAGTEYPISLPEGSLVTDIAFDVDSDVDDISGAIILYKNNGESDVEFKREEIKLKEQYKLNQNVQEKISKIEVQKYHNDFTVRDLVITYTMPNKFDITPKETELTIGDTVRLNVSGAKGDINWGSSDGWQITNENSEYVLTVNKPGWFMITGTDSEGKIGCCVVYVEPFAITNVSDLSNSTAKFTANKAANWSIDNTDLAVISGEVNGTACTVNFNENVYGKATLTATYGDYTATAELSVLAPTKSGIKVNKVEDGTEIIGVEPNTSSAFKISNNNYYYSKDSLMVMPLPEKNLTFVNKPGLAFRKVDDEGKAVKDAEITITPQVTDGTWKYDADTGKGTIDVEKLEKDKVYKFSETKTPGGYEKADDIYFKKTTDNKIKYWTGSETEPSELGKYTTLNLPDEHTIFMTDQRKLGAKITLKKVEQGSDTSLEGAKFSLYSTDDEENPIITDLNGNGNLFDNEEFKALDNEYAKNGYLLPGTYYLVETAFPTRADEEEYENPGRIYFTVKDDYSIEKGIYVNHKLDIMSEPNYSWCVYKDLKLDYEKDSPVVIKDVVEFTIRADKAFGQCYVTGFAFEEGEASSTSEINHKFDTPQDISTFKIQDWWHNSPKITYAELITSDGTKYSTDSEEVGYSEFNDMLEVSDSTLKISNKIQGDERKIIVTKKWENDEDFTSLIPDLRPNEIKVQLYCTTQEINDISKLTGDMKCNQEGIESLITLDETNNWTYTWENLKNKDSSKIRYHYYVKEVSNIPNYDAEYSVDEEGRLVITNTLKTISINAVKKWEVDKNTNINKPECLNLTLQMQISDNEWRDIRTITLTDKDEQSDGSWQKVIDGLPAGKEYRLVEKNPPPGWKCVQNDNENVSVPTYENDKLTTLTITNKPLTASLTIRKFWENDNENQRTSVKFKLYRTTTKTLENLKLEPSPTGALWPKQTSEQVQSDYARLLQYSLFFYDGVMCGTGVDENSAYKWRADCHEDDEVPGGFHDAGDHVMFGLPAGFSASNLGWSLYEFRDDYDYLGQTDHTKVITDYYADFFSRCIRDNNGKTEILVQKGHGNIDHAYWGIPELQDSRENEMYWRSDAGADIAAEYAASLALSYLNFHDKDEAKYSEYLKKAKEFYAFSERVKEPLNEWGVNLDETQNGVEYPGFYKSDSAQDDQAWAASWLALACQAKGDNTGYNDYKSKASGKLSGLDNGWGGYHWNNVALGAKCVNAAYLGGNWGNVKDFVTSECTGTGYKDTNAWGQTRYNCGYQTIALAAANHSESDVDVDAVKDWCESQMDYILGDCCGTALVTNFSENSTQKPHFRAGAGQRYEMEVKDDESIINGYDNDVFRLIGGLVGGPETVGSSYTDSRNDYQANEVASDYNANLVGAAAGLYHFFGTGYTYEIPGVENSYNGKPDPAAQPHVQIINELPMLMMAKAAVLRAAEKCEIVDASVYDQSGDITIPIPEKLYGVAITLIKIEFDKSSGNGTIQLEPWGNGTNQFDYNLTQGAVFSFSPDRIANDTNASDTLKSIIIKRYWNDGQKVKNVSFYYDAGNSFTVTPESDTLLISEKIKLTINGAEDNITWNTGGNGSVDKEGDDWYYTAGNTEGSVTITGIDSEDKTGECTIEVQNFKFTESPDSIPEGGSAVFKLNGSVDSWDYDNNLTITDNGDNSYTVQVKEGASGNFTITANHGNNQAQATFSIATGVLQITNSPVKLRINYSKKIELNLTSGNITYEVDNSSVAEISTDGTITAKAIGTTNFTVIRNGSTATGTIEVIGDLTISGINQMNQNQTARLTVENNIGTVSWSSSDGNIATVDENGNVHSIAEGTVKITAKDTDGFEAAHIIEIKETAVIPDIPDDKEFVDYIVFDMTNYKESANEWEQILELSPVAPNGKKYYYYIEEVDPKTDQPIKDNNYLQGKGAKYIPVAYINGVSLDETGNAELSAKNKKTADTLGELPMTGGHGTTRYYVTGIAIMSTAAAYYLIRRRRRRVAK